ncbi:hypothetical protein [uncultured Nonlabens sp.]|uniref:hypothetical protein n=1 Tax=uncultured Nonlabens sp. TaxID=859306 RepID=UPI00260AC89E|nr:hypothetical protein [uncultured Nonlabens sp.]
MQYRLFYGTVYDVVSAFAKASSTSKNLYKFKLCSMLFYKKLIPSNYIFKGCIVLHDRF